MQTQCLLRQLMAIYPSKHPVNSLYNFIKNTIEALEMKGSFVYVIENLIRPSNSHHADGYST